MYRRRPQPASPLFESARQHVHLAGQVDGHAEFAAIGETDCSPDGFSRAVGSNYSVASTAAMTQPLRNPKCGRRGAALMLALWALFLLSAMIVSWALDIDSRLTLSGNANRLLEAEAMACSGAEVALNPLIKPGSPNLNGGLGAGKTYEARITGEGGRLDLNWLVAGGNPEKLEILRRYLENKGIDLNERDTMMDSLLDWVEPNTGLHRLNAPPENEDYHPPHAGGLARVAEL